LDFGLAPTSKVADVADVLGIRLGTAKARLHRALGRLRVALGEEGETDGA
jgi:DNA-directed RNA polymerase specialized sigma24 family protein